MKKVLWISPFVPYDNVRHAGGKTHNFYIKYFQKSGKFDINLISLALPEDEKNFDLDKYGISNDVYIVGGNKIKDLCRAVYNFNSFYNSRHWLCKTILSYQYHVLKKYVRSYAKDNVPDIVIMQWTGAGFLLPYIKKLFPNAYTVIIEEDVSFLGYKRRYMCETDTKQKKKYERLYKHLISEELSLLSNCNLVVVNNGKDKELLVKNGIDSRKIYTAAPYYDDYSCVERNNVNKSVIFYGVMDREENHNAAMWFARNVMPKVSDSGVSFEVIGNNPKDELKNLESENIHIKGFVQNVKPYFEQCLCMAVPLQLGAGIKVKILEGLSAGIPVLTNEIGIEGIPAKKDEEFFYCEKDEDYANVIKRLLKDSELESEVGKNAKKFMSENYNLSRQLDGLIEILDKS